MPGFGVATKARFSLTSDPGSSSAVVPNSAPTGAFFDADNNALWVVIWGIVLLAVIWAIFAGLLF